MPELLLEVLAVFLHDPQISFVFFLLIFGKLFSHKLSELRFAWGPEFAGYLVVLPSEIHLLGEVLRDFKKSAGLFEVGEKFFGGVQVEERVLSETGYVLVRIVKSLLEH